MSSETPLVPDPSMTYSASQLSYSYFITCSLLPRLHVHHTLVPTSSAFDEFRVPTR